MANSLREEVEELANGFDVESIVSPQWIFSELREILNRHPPPGDDWEIGYAQAVEFAQYVEDHAKGSMREAAKRFLSLPYSQSLAKRIIPADTNQWSGGV